MCHVACVQRILKYLCLYHRAQYFSIQQYLLRIVTRGQGLMWFQVEIEIQAVAVNFHDRLPWGFLYRFPIPVKQQLTLLINSIYIYLPVFSYRFRTLHLNPVTQSLCITGDDLSFQQRKEICNMFICKSLRFISLCLCIRERPGLIFKYFKHSLVSLVYPCQKFKKPCSLSSVSNYLMLGLKNN